MKKLIPCLKCNGTGFIKEYAHIDNGLCYKCNGEKKVKASNEEYNEYLKSISVLESIDNEDQKRIIKAFITKKKDTHVYVDENTKLESHFKGMPASFVIKGDISIGFYIVNKGLKIDVKPTFSNDDKIKWFIVN